MAGVADPISLAINILDISSRAVASLHRRLKHDAAKAGLCSRIQGELNSLQAALRRHVSPRSSRGGHQRSAGAPRASPEWERVLISHRERLRIAQQDLEQLEKEMAAGRWNAVRNADAINRRLHALIDALCSLQAELRTHGLFIEGNEMLRKQAELHKRELAELIVGNMSKVEGRIVFLQNAVNNVENIVAKLTDMLANPAFVQDALVAATRSPPSPTSAMEGLANVIGSYVEHEGSSRSSAATLSGVTAQLGALHVGDTLEDDSVVAKEGGQRIAQLEENTRRFIRRMESSQLSDEKKAKAAAVVAQLMQLASPWKVEPSDLQIVKDAEGDRVELGDGGFARVYLGTQFVREHGYIVREVDVAIKVLSPTSDVSEDTRVVFLREVALLSAAQHENVVKFMGAHWPEGPSDSPLASGDLELLGPAPDAVLRKPFIVMELMDQSLRISKNSGIVADLNAKLDVLLSVAKALEFLHQKHIVHQDIKPDNVLVKVENGKVIDVKVSDFGVSRFVRSTASMTRCRTSLTGDGTKSYMAPEAILRRGCQSVAVDAWGFGALACFLLLGRTAVCELSDAQIDEEARTHSLHHRTQEWASRISVETLKRLITTCFAKDPSRRPKMADLRRDLEAVVLGNPCAPGMDLPLPRDIAFEHGARIPGGAAGGVGGQAPATILPSMADPLGHMTAGSTWDKALPVSGRRSSVPYGFPVGAHGVTSLVSPPPSAPLLGRKHVTTLDTSRPARFDNNPGVARSTTAFATSRPGPSTQLTSTHLERMGFASDSMSSKLYLELSVVGLSKPGPLSSLVGRHLTSVGVVVDEQIGEDAPFRKVGQTELISNEGCPHWLRQLSVSYQPGRWHRLKFTVHDAGRIHGDGQNFQTKVLGTVVKTLRECLINKSKSYPFLDLNGRNCSLCVRVHERTSSDTFRVQLNMHAKNLDAADVGGKSDPYVVVKHIVGVGEEGVSVLAKSEIVRQSLNPRWMRICFDVYPNGIRAKDIKLLLSILDWDERKSDDPLGDVAVTLADLIKPGQHAHNVINKVKSERSSRYRNSGQLYTEGAAVEVVPNHVEYLRGGCRLRVVCAVDMSKTSGSPTDVGSHHYQSPCGGNSLFEDALQKVGTVVQPYLPHDQLLRAYGYGAKPAGLQMPEKDIFPLNPAVFSKSQDERLTGFEDVINAYRQCLKPGTLQHGKRPRMSRVIETALRHANDPAPTQANQRYTILLLFTSGECHDLEKTRSAIVRASGAGPLSIVIIDVGGGRGRHWTEIAKLGADNGVLPATLDGRTATRDIVDCLEFDRSATSADLETSLFAEIPCALRNYLSSNGIRPNPPQF